MNYLEITSFIEAKRKSKAYIEQQLSEITSFTYNLKSVKPVKWYHDFYYITKRSILLFTCFLSLLLLIISFTHEKFYRDYFKTDIESLISVRLNKTFGTNKSITVVETSATDSNKTEASVLKPVRKEIQDRINSDIYNYSLIAGRITLILLSIIFFYIARLTRKLYLKNKLISNYYSSNLDIINIYKQVIEEQNFEIQFLTNALKSK